MDLAGLQHAVLSLDASRFNDMAMQVFRYQSCHCEVYRRYLEHLQLDPSKIINSAEIPHLPISFFKQFDVKTDAFQPEMVFESSSTTGTGVSRHFVRDLTLYRSSFTESFSLAFGDHRQYCHLALLPSYLERQHSSLVYQVGHFIESSVYPQSAFYLQNHRSLYEQLAENEAIAIPTVLWGVSFALLDFTSAYSLPLRHSIVIETGGMKGRRKEITRDELHATLKHAFSTDSIAGEYGMTELMSQAYALRDGLYKCPPWMQVKAREINDPFALVPDGRHGALNVTDLYNLHTCAFIETSDLGKVYADGRFEVLGRIDHSDVRGCNLLL